MKVLIDTGSTYSFIRSSALGSLRHSPVRPQTVNLTLADGSTPFSVIGEVSLNLRLKHIHTPVCCFVVKNLCCECLIGTDWIKRNLVTLDFHNQRLTISNDDSYASVRLDTDVENIRFPVRLLKNTTVPPYAQIVVPTHVPISFSRHALFTSRPTLGSNRLIKVPSAVLPISQYTTHRTISNPTNRHCYLACNTRLGHVTLLRSTTSLAPITRSMNPSSLPKSITVPPVSSPSLSTIIDDLTQHVSNLNDERTALRAVLTKYASLFDTSTPKIADTTSVHTIRTGDAHPQNSRAYPQNSEQRTATENIIENMMRVKQIRPSISSWSSPMLLARKKDNTYRFVIDYRKLNAVSTEDTYPMPTIE
jgi:hypothetical protein